MTNIDNYCVYQHTCPNGMVYIGVTKNVKYRWRPSLYKDCSLEQYIEQFGWDAITHEVLYENLTHEEALKREDELICKARMEGKCINERRSGQYQQSDEFKEKEKSRLNVWYKEHPEAFKAIRKRYYEKNKDKINARRREKRKNKKK